MTLSTAPEHVDLTTEDVGADLLAGNLVLGITVVDVRRVGGRGGVGDARGGDEGRVVALGLGTFEDGTAGLLVRVDADVSVDTLETARIGGGRGGRVGDERVGGTGANLTDEELVEGQGDVPGEALVALHVLTGKGLGGGTETVRDELDDVGLSAVVVALSLGSGGGAESQEHDSSELHKDALELHCGGGEGR